MEDFGECLGYILKWEKDQSILSSLALLLGSPNKSVITHVCSPLAPLSLADPRPSPSASYRVEPPAISSSPAFKKIPSPIIGCAAPLPISILGGAVPLSTRDSPSSTVGAWCWREDDDDVCLPYLTEPIIPQQSTFQRSCSVVIDMFVVRGPEW